MLRRVRISFDCNSLLFYYLIRYFIGGINLDFSKYMTLDNIFSVIIPLAISVAGFFINSSNTGKKIERYKRILDSKDVSFTKSIEIYEGIRNLLVDNIFEGCQQVDFIDNYIIGIKELLRKNEFYVPDKIYKKMDKIVNNVDTYNDHLDERHDLKLESDGKKDKLGDEQRKRINEIDSMQKNALVTLNREFRVLKKVMHKKYSIF